MTAPFVERDFGEFLAFLKEQRGLDFTGYKRASVMRRVGVRLQQVRVDSLSDYISHLEADPEEFSHLLNTILINVTGFFRDTAAWEYLAQEIIPKLLADKPKDEPLRVWSAGCASGEETYSLAILLAEALGEQEFARRVKIYGTDIDDEALTQARHATYSPKDVQPVGEELRRKYFRASDGKFAFNAELRRSVIFGKHDLLRDAPISNLDLLACRNTLMYFNAETQRRVLSLLHFALARKGYLFLGKAEMLLTHTNLFTPVHLKHRIFTKVPVVNHRDRGLLLGPAGNGVAADHLAAALRLRDSAFDLSPFPQLLLDPAGMLVQANLAARTLFGLSTDDLGASIFDLEVSRRPVDLRSRLDEISRTMKPILVPRVRHDMPDGHAAFYDVQLVPLVNHGDRAVGVGVIFSDITAYGELQDELNRSKGELETAYEELQSANEELETTNEELQSSNEELETTNEELQSSNEELETMNEELQSANEELETANEQLRQRSDELASVSSFQDSILWGLYLAVVVVEQNGAVRIWNRQAEDLWGLRAEEAQGQFFLNLDIGLPLDQLRQPLRRVLSGESSMENSVVEAVNRRGKKIMCRVHCTPLLDAQRHIQGAIVIMEELEDKDRAEGEEQP
ncbi:MAG: CheR family methyltransferase [Armatimonadota bacterium]